MARLFLFTLITLFLLHFCSGGIEREAHALLQFKASLKYSTDVLSSWGKGKDCCLWHGVSCDNTTHHVVAVDIDGTSLLVSNYSDDYEYDAFPNSLKVEANAISESLCKI